MTTAMVTSCQIFYSTVPEIVDSDGRIDYDVSWLQISIDVLSVINADTQFS